MMTRIQALVALQKRYAACIPPDLAARSWVSHERDGTLHIEAETAAAAAKLRNLTARILNSCGVDRPDLTAIKVGTQPTRRPGGDVRQVRALGDEARQQLMDLSDRLPPGALKDSIARWSRR